ncbi:MAG: YjbE family putative metal transport protein [Hyphomicrobiales bacterium]|nr:YjbE family putative metal transport protein [Hyphomicrobiales bacterium]
MDFGDGATWLVIPVQIFFVDLLLGADNALLIGLACRSLGPKDTPRAIAVGAGGAVVMRLLLTIVATSLLAVPFVKLIGAAVLILIALNASQEHGPSERPPSSPARARTNIWSAASVIVFADAAMSLDNVVALAAIARGNFWLLAVGVALSLPVLAYGGLILTTLLRRAPGIVTLGAALLGWIAGDMAITDPLIAGWAYANAPGLVAVAPALGAAFVFLGSRLRRDQALEPAAHLEAPRGEAPMPSATQTTAPSVPDARAEIVAAVPALSPTAKSAAPTPRGDRVGMIGVLILAVVAGLALMLVSYLDNLN